MPCSPVVCCCGMPRPARLARLQALTNVFYHPMEEVALVGGIAPKLFPVDTAWWWARSDWAWVR